MTRLTCALAILIAYVWMVSPLKVYPQDSECSSKVFSNQWLNEPNDFSDSIFNAFSYEEIDLYNARISDSLVVLLENGYAKWKIQNPKDYLNRINETPHHDVHTIEIVYTRQPWDKDVWQTNYNVLLGNRIHALLELDSALNSPDIHWKLVLQTSGKDKAEAEKLFHGIVLHYKPSEVPENEVTKIDTPKQEMREPIQIDTLDFMYRTSERPSMQKRDFGRQYGPHIRVPDLPCPRRR